MEQKKAYNPVGWFEIYVDDMPRAQKFYETILDLTMQDLPVPDGHNMKMVAFPMAMDVPNASGALVKMQDMKAGGNSTIVYFSSEDCAVEAGRVEGAGGKVIQSKTSIGEYGFMALCTDTEGNMFGIHSQM